MSAQIHNILSASGSDSGFLFSEFAFSESDLMFASMLRRLTDSRSDAEAFIYAYIASRTSKGHICVDTGSQDFRHFLKKLDNYLNPDEQCPDIIKMLENLPASGSPDDRLPLVRAGRFIYLKKFWDFQNIIEGFINSGKPVFPALSEKKTESLISSYFPVDESLHGSYNWQMGAAICAVRNRFCVITGGPGTGKTTTAARIISILAELLEDALERKPRIFLAAPTGKAAARLASSINEANSKLKNSNSESGFLSGRMDIPDIDKPETEYAASTLHRLLGIGHISSKPKYNRYNPLPADVLLVDEASMIDIGMMAAIMDSLPQTARLVIMGDKDQLSSVEPGAVLADICEAGPPLKFSEKASGFLGMNGIFPDNLAITEKEGFHDGVAELDRSYRFNEKSGIGHLAAAVKGSDPIGAWGILQNGHYPDVSVKTPDSEKKLEQIIYELLSREFCDISASESPEKAIEVMDSFRILCALREGSRGVGNLNAFIRRMLHEKYRIPLKGDWYHGRPVMITGNDYNLGLFNGDTGIAFSNADTGADDTMKVYFRSGDGKIKDFHPARLGKHETVYASTVHKSQGSEYDRVILVLPDDFSRVLSMELVYTAVTRAKKEFIMIGNRDVFSMAVDRRAERTSGLRDRLLGKI